jgi:hypothetical protein
MFDESTARVVILDRRCIDRQSIPYAMLGALNDTALCPLPGMHVNLSLDELSFSKCRRILGGGNATECSKWSLPGSCETDDLLGAQQESAVRVQVSSPRQHRHRACRKEEEKLLICIHS